MANANAPGLAVLTATLMLFGSLVAIAWHEDQLKEAQASKKLSASTFVTGSNMSSYSR